MGGKLSTLHRWCTSKTTSQIEIVPSDNPVFGVALSDARRSEKHPLIPKIVVECIDFLERGDLIQSKGIYRVSGLKTKTDAAVRAVILPGANCNSTASMHFCS